MQQDKFMFMLICWPRQRQQHQLQQVYYVVSLVLTHQLLFKKKSAFYKNVHVLHYVGNGQFIRKK